MGGLPDMVITVVTSAFSARLGEDCEGHGDKSVLRSLSSPLDIGRPQEVVNDCEQVVVIQPIFSSYFAPTINERAVCPSGLGRI